MSNDEDYLKDQIPCWLTYTNQTSHDIINKTFIVPQCSQELLKG